MDKKISITILLVLIFSFVILIISLYYYENYLRNSSHVSDLSQQEQFFSSLDKQEKKIFLIGSSHIVALNSTILENSLNNHDFSEYSIYNLSIAGDKPSKRLQTIDLIISSKPDLVIYGISDRDFSGDSSNQNSIQTPPSFLPVPSYLIQNIIDKFFPHEQFFYLENPKFLSLEFLSKLVNSNNEHLVDKIYLDYAPFITVTKENLEIITDDLLLQKMALSKYYSTFDRIIPASLNSNALALQEMITIFHNNDVEFILLITPQQKYYIDSMPEQYTDSFHSIISSFSEIPNVKTHSLFYKYQNMTIFSNLTHVSINNSIYNDEIANLIIKTLEN